MIRVPSAPRANLAARLGECGFSFATCADGTPYWDETAHYRFSLDQVERDLEAPTDELAALCAEFVGRAVSDEATFARLSLPPALGDLARESWRRGDRSLYGRFDLSYDGASPARMLEYNADTPTGLYETAAFQWGWLEDMVAAGALPADADQFNSVHDALVARWPDVASGRVHLMALPNEEDARTVLYLASTAEGAGLAATAMAVAEVGDDGTRFVDLERRPIDTLFKLYPWEWLVADPFARSAAMSRTRFVEPAWKAILSTKAVLPLLWEMEPGHPNLLPARFSDDATGADVGRSFVRKPLRSREGANVSVHVDGALVEETPGTYGGPWVVQALAPLPDFAGNRPVVGSWVVGDRACGVMVRESRSAITTDASRFVPHAIA